MIARVVVIAKCKRRARAERRSRCSCGELRQPFVSGFGGAVVQLMRQAFQFLRGACSNHLGGTGARNGLRVGMSRTALPSCLGLRRRAAGKNTAAKEDLQAENNGEGTKGGAPRPFRASWFAKVTITAVQN